jgi:hypothetical protein
MLASHWVERDPDSRALVVTGSGARELTVFGLRLRTTLAATARIAPERAQPDTYLQDAFSAAR